MTMTLTAPISRTERPILFSGPMVRATLQDVKNQTRRVVKNQPTGKYPMRFDDESGEWYEDGGTWSAKCPYGKPGDLLWVRHAWHHYTPSSTNPANEQVWDEFTRCVRWIDRSPSVVMDCQPDVSGREWRKRPSIHMPRWASWITLEIVNVRVERLQDISAADIIAEGVTVDAVTDMLSPLNKEKPLPCHWFSLEIDGGWETDHDHHPYCEGCGVRLEGYLTIQGKLAEAEHFKSFGGKITSGVAHDLLACIDELPPKVFWQVAWTVINGHENWNENPWVWVIEFKHLQKSLKTSTGSQFPFRRAFVRGKR